MAQSDYPTALLSLDCERVCTNPIAAIFKLLNSIAPKITAKGSNLINAAAASWFHGRASDLASDVASLVSSGMVVDAIPPAIGEIFGVE